jgi:hypothetical protein
MSTATWEFNNKGLLYVPLSGNWADEYITDGYVLYDQLLRFGLWKVTTILGCQINSNKIEVTKQIEVNLLRIQYLRSTMKELIMK